MMTKLKMERKFKKRTKGAQMTKNAWRQRQNTVWVKDGKEAQKEQKVLNRLLQRCLEKKAKYSLG